MTISEELFNYEIDIARKEVLQYINILRRRLITLEQDAQQNRVYEDNSTTWILLHHAVAKLSALQKMERTSKEA